MWHERLWCVSRRHGLASSHLALQRLTSGLISAAACSAEVAKTLLKTLDDADAAASKVGIKEVILHAVLVEPFQTLPPDTLHKCVGVCLQSQVEVKKPLTAAALREAIDLIRGAVMICYPAGLPEWDFVRQCLEETEDLTGTSVGML